MDAHSAEAQKRRKKSQEESAAAAAVGGLPEDALLSDDELELYQVVQDDLHTKATVGWQNAVRSLNAALVHLNSDETQRFLAYSLPKIVNIMLDQHSSKIGSVEKNCVIQTLSVSIRVIVEQLRAGRPAQMLAILATIFNKKRTFYKDLRASPAMIGTYWNKLPGSPEVRSQSVAAFCELQGFQALIPALEQMLQTQETDKEPQDASASEEDMNETLLDCEDLRVLLQALLEFRNSVPETVSTKIMTVVLEYLTKVPKAMLKDSRDSMGAILTMARRFVDAGVVPSDAITNYWLEITQRYVEYGSLPPQLFGLEQLNQIVNFARASRPFPKVYLVQHAGTEVVNGVYKLKHESGSATYTRTSSETGQVFTLFCCTMKSGLKWWFISEADKMQPGSDQDIDYYQHQSQYEEYLPPTHHWVVTGKGEEPPPELSPGPIDEDEGQDHSQRLDQVLIAWIRDQKIVENCFGDGIHHQIVPRIAPLVKFLAESQSLDEHYLDVIWDSCLQKDHALAEEVHNLVITTVPVLSDELLLHLVEYMHSSLRSCLGKKEACPEVVAFLHRLASSCPSLLLERSQQVTTSVLQLLWTIQLYCSVESLRLTRQLRDFFLEGLRAPFGQPLRQQLLNECIDGLKASAAGETTVEEEPLLTPDEAATKFLELLKFLVESYRADQAVIVEELEQQHALVQLLFQELAAFSSRSTDKTSMAYRNAIGHRLELLHYVHVTSSKLELSVSQIEELWGILSSPTEREFCLIFFNQSCAKPPSSSFTPDTSTPPSAFGVQVCQHVFQLLCEQVDFETLSSVGYKCFHTYFTRLNAAPTPSAENALQVVGLDALWRIAFRAPVDVSELATKELLSVYEGYAADQQRLGSAQAVETSVKDFLDRVFEQLATVEDASPSSLLLVQQCTSLLDGLVATTRIPQAFVSHGRSGRGAEFTLKVVVQRIPASSSGAPGGPLNSSDNAVRTMFITVHANETLQQLRQSLETSLGHPLQQTKLLSSGAAVTGDKKTLSELRLTDASEVRVLLFQWVVQRAPASPIDHTMDSSSEDVEHPAEVLASDFAYFETFFRVLDLMPTHAAHTQLWEFLRKIPTNKQLLERVSTIGSPSDTSDWSSVLQNVPQHQAVYTLQIMDALLLPSDPRKTEFAQTYLERFASGGGFRQVLQFFLDADLHQASFNQGPAVALRILKFGLFDHANDRLTDADDDVPTLHLDVTTEDYAHLAAKIGQLVVSEHQGASDDQEMARTMTNALKMVQSIVHAAPSAADAFLAADKLQSIVVSVLLRTQSDLVRDHWVATLQSMCTASSSAADAVFAQFVHSVPQLEELDAPCEQYVRMLQFLARIEAEETKCRTLAHDVLSKLQRGFSSKFLACNEYAPELLVGLLDFLRDVLHCHVAIRKEMAHEVLHVMYDDCLFALPSAHRRRGPLCVSLDARRAAFKVLATAVSTDVERMSLLHEKLESLFSKCDSRELKWGHESHQIETRGNAEHVGMKNQGCTCYMNSFMQQLFMYPRLRQGLLRAQVPPRPSPKEPTDSEVEVDPSRLVGCRVALECLGNRVYEASVVAYDELTGQHTVRRENGAESTFILSEGRPGNENGRYAILPTEVSDQEATLEVLRQVQRTFCYLRDSEMRYFDTKALVEACNCLNLEFSVYQQNDASEFCDKLLDRLETGLKNTVQGTACLDEPFNGKLLSQKLPKGCGHRYEKQEPFIRVELQIHGKQSIEESLAHFVEGEVMDGNNKVECELCEAKKAAVRRTCIGELPNLLVVHLKRFAFDYDMAETVKLNSRCSFPMTLDMKPYTKAGLEADEKEETDKSKTDEASDSSSSYEFMDKEEDVGFDYRLKGILVHSGIAQGGHYYSIIYNRSLGKWFKFEDEDVTPFDASNIETECFGGVQRRSWHGGNGMDVEVMSNALMLFYEKIEADESMQVEEEEAPCEYEQEVWTSNEAFLQKSYLFDAEFHEFLREMVQLQHLSDDDQALDTTLSTHVQTTLTNIGVEFVLSVLLHSRDKLGIARWLDVLSDKFAVSKEACEYLFTSLAGDKRQTWLQALLFECPDAIARQSFAQLVSRAIECYELHVTSADETSSLVSLIHAVADLLDKTPVLQQGNLEECFLLVRNAAETSATIRQELQQKDMVARLVLFFLTDRAPQELQAAFPSSRLPPSTMRYASPDYQYLLEAIVAILGLPRNVQEPLVVETSSQYPSRPVLTEKAKQAFTQVFLDLQTDDAMGLTEIQTFLRLAMHAAKDSPAVAHNSQQLVVKYGAGDPPTLSLDSFLAYCTDASVTNAKQMQQQLQALGFNDRLEKQQETLPTADTVLAHVSDLSRDALLSEVLMDSALEEDADTAGNLLTRLCVGDRVTSERLVKALLVCLKNAETEWKGQPVVETCARELERLLSHPTDFQQELVQMTLTLPDVGLLTTDHRDKARQHYLRSSQVPQLVYRQILVLMELRAHVSSVREWMDGHKDQWEWMYEWLRRESLKPSLGGRLAVLYRDPGKTELLCRVGEALDIPYKPEERAYVVEGAGIESVNGIYKSTGSTHDKCLIYSCVKDDIDYTLFRCCLPSKARRWYISYSPNKSLLGTLSDEDYYFVQCQLDDDSPPEEGWKVWTKNEKSGPPAPTVRLHSSTIDPIEDEFANPDLDDVTAELESDDEIRVSNERFRAVHLDNQDDGDQSSGADDFL